MARDREREVPWGGFLLIAALAGVALAIFFYNDIQRVVRGTYVVVAALPEGGGVRPGAPAWVAGRESGRVTRVDLLRATDVRTGGIVVEVEFPASIRDVLRAGSTARLAAASPTAGDIIEFLPGPGAELTPADTVWGVAPSSRPEEVVAQLGALARGMRDLFGQVQTVADAGAERLERLDQLGEQAGDVGVLLDRFLETASRAAARRTELAGDLEQLTEGLGRMGTLLADAREALRGPEAHRAEMRALRESLPASIEVVRTRLEALATALDDPNGTLLRLQSDGALWRALEAARAEADALIAELSAHPGRAF